MLLKGKAAVITGAASPRGIGLAVARLFAEHGARVALLDLDSTTVKAATRELKGRGHLGLKCDVTRQAHCEKAVERVAERFGTIDVLVNIAGITSPERLLEMTGDSYSKIMDVNMRGTLHLTQAVVPHMQRSGAGSIVNMSSVSAQRGGGVFGGAHYSAAKAAVLGYTKAAARELGPDNIRVNAVCPSFIDTDITAGMMTPETLQKIVESVPMGRPGRAEEVAGCILFLASDLSSYVTGSEVDINGGSHIH
jgi:NAD(P)-dependent dehydrogenase (short-subunit alcohol dehydrogenase family)